MRLSNIEKYAPSYVDGHRAGSERIADGAVAAHVVEDHGDNTRRPLPAFPDTPPLGSARTGLRVHRDDLTPELGPLAAHTPISITGCICEHVHHKDYRLSEARIASLHAVMNDGLARASSHFGCPATTLMGDDPVQALCDWAAKNELTEIVSLAPMVGPVRDMVPRLTQQLTALGIRLSLIRRPSDALAFSMAGAGFFPLWQKMSRHLSQVSRL